MENGYTTLKWDQDKTKKIMKENKYEQDLNIDDSALDLEWLEQPALMLKYTTLQADARRKMEYCKEKLNVTRADLDKDIRTDPDKYDLLKVTENSVTNCIITQKGYKEDHKALIESQYEYDVVRGAVSAVDHRKTALENEVRLFGLGYFAGPKVPRELDYGQREVINESQKEMKERRSNSSIKIKRRRS